MVTILKEILGVVISIFTVFLGDTLIIDAQSKITDAQPYTG